MGNPHKIRLSKDRFTDSSESKLIYTEYQLNENCNLIATEKVWLEDGAKTQLTFCSKLKNMVRVSGMPDLHPGKDAPIGAAFLSRNHLYPALVGSDIGCGIALWQTTLPTHKANINKLTKKLGDIDDALDESWQALIKQRQAELGLDPTPFDNALGTIGSGNHFAEITVLDKVYGDYASKYSLQSNHLHLLIHSGSRGLGAQIFKTHAYQAGHQGIVWPGEAATAYLNAHEQALRFAYLNREMIARRILARVNSEGKERLSVHHNFVEPIEYATQHDGQYFLHRKGAAPSDQGLVVIAGTRGSFSYLVEPTPQLKSLNSIAHGAGRKWARGECQSKLSRRYSHWREFERTEFGGRVICESKNLAYEEAPEAYKSVDSVIESLQAAHLIKVVARLRPLITYKTQQRR